MVSKTIDQIQLFEDENVTPYFKVLSKIPSVLTKGSISTGLSSLFTQKKVRIPTGGHSRLPERQTRSPSYQSVAVIYFRIHIHFTFSAHKRIHFYGTSISFHLKEGPNPHRGTHSFSRTTETRFPLLEQVLLPVRGCRDLLASLLIRKDSISNKEKEKLLQQRSFDFLK
ncbi:hypothetical protein JTE90_019590 [Oedothorax gibbosus]|uniref:Uncharacterized protein n=1 Tax=Oedothorax gibbosus TaxID=931172 RepID=A0AAV6V5F6_9ARAC|nr:hypothetical protein JTE90_019590 [Oedothorax gibbosus]